jgi:outer membrane protein OmpA-like peptidoglycan-associated protein
VTTAAGAQVLDQAGESTQAVSEDAAPKEPEILDRERIQVLFREALANEPLPPIHRRLYFHFDSTVPRPESEALLPRTVEEARARVSCNVNVIGHTDRMGRDRYNRQLSLYRALAVKQALQSLGLPERCLKVRYYGESDPLIPTPDGKAEPRNRRVEIEIR